MNYVKRTASLLLAICILIGACGCGSSSKDKKGNKDIGGYSENTERDYNDTVSDWKSDGEFDNTSKTDSKTPTPGMTASGESTTSTNAVTTAKVETVKAPPEDVNIDKVEPDTIPAHKLPESDLTDNTNLMFYYEGINYAYGVTNDGLERIAFRDESGRLYDVLAGGGKYNLRSSTGGLMLEIGKVVKAEAVMKDSYDAVEITYILSGSAAANARIKTTYVFKESSISFSSQITAESKTMKFSSERSSLLRGFANGYTAYDCRVNGEWIYPANGDYPYQDFESLMFRNDIDDSLILYSFMRGDDLPTNWVVENYNGEALPLTFEDAKGLLYTMNYDICFVDTKEESEQSPNYRALFKSLSADFAAGVAAITDSGDNSTVFVGNEVELNLNVTNLTEDDLIFSLRYDIRDYYGKIVDSGIFKDSTVYKYSDANRTVKVGGKYGMYYLNLYVISKYSSYIECFPFALLENYTYKYSATNPYGLNSPNCDDDDIEEWRDTGRLQAKVGTANTRVGATEQQYAMIETMQELGITRFNGGYGPTNDNEAGIPSYEKNVLEAVEALAKYVDSFEVGNEMSLMALKSPDDPRYVPSDLLYTQFYQYTYKPSVEAMAKKYPHITYVPCPFSACEQDWMRGFTSGFDYDTDKDGVYDLHLPAIWDEISVVSTHIYGQPQMPDSYGLYKPVFNETEKGGLWQIESGMQRMREFLDKYGDKEFYITEIGYATPPADSTSTCLRTQADYNVRTGILCAAYGADRIQYYCFHDRISWSSGFENENGEYNFGAFYEADYYGIVKPKPWGVGFAVMTRQLESLKKDALKIYDKYDEGWDKPGVRAFKADTAVYGNIVIAYSNHEVLSNGKKSSVGTCGDRTPVLPWNNQWTKVDDTVFDATGDTVTVYDIMGNKTEYPVSGGKVSIPLTGSPVYIHGVN